MAAPMIAGTRFFSFSEVKKMTNNFSDDNEIGVGGYGKVCLHNACIHELSVHVVQIKFLHREDDCMIYFRHW